MDYAQDVPTGTGRDAIEGETAEEGRTGEVVGKGLTEAEVVIPVVVGKTEEETDQEEVEARQVDETTPTAVPSSTPAPEKGQVTSPGTTSGGGTGRSSGGQTVTSGNSNIPGARGTVTEPSQTMSDRELSASELRGLVGEDDWYPSAEDVMESTTSRSRPLRALERMRRITRGAPGPRRGGRRTGEGGGGSGVGTMDVFAVLAQVNDQLGSAPDLESFLKVVVGVIKDLTQFHRVLVYQFDEQWNGQVSLVGVIWRARADDGV
ncbi:Light-sensor Protein kinase [Ceratobasidium sp. UAMH 11750]|nr:Light-sensor Protein kinase [Ceratobasidium sp. UAMH 11750]